MSTDSFDITNYNYRLYPDFHLYIPIAQFIDRAKCDKWRSLFRPYFSMAVL